MHGSCLPPTPDARLSKGSCTSIVDYLVKDYKHTYSTSNTKRRKHFFILSSPTVVPLLVFVEGLAFHKKYLDCY